MVSTIYNAPNPTGVLGFESYNPTKNGKGTVNFQCPILRGKSYRWQDAPQQCLFPLQIYNCNYTKLC